jgi:hypothetical protein
MANEFFTNEYTETIQKLVHEVVNDPSSYMGSKYLPSIALPVQRVRTEVIEATGGLTSEHVIGSSPQYIQSFGTRVQEYTPPYYKEAIHYDETRILYLREVGQNGRNVRGIQKFIDLDIDRLNRRIEARIEKQRWDTIFNGGFSYLGKTVSFGIPSGNRVTPVGAVWSSDGTSANNSADPIRDLRYWVMGGSSAFRKYNITGLVMNPNTARWILDNSNTRAYLTSYGANPALSEFDLNKALQFLIPGLPAVFVYKGWYQTESVSSGKISVSDATYFIPDGYIYFECALPGNDKIGEFVQTVHLAAGSINDPGYGKFLVIEDNTQPGSKGGPGNPYIDLIGGVYGGVKLDRAFDVLTAKVVS